jgi:glycine betaine/proline transport system substrate-binding protein
MRKMKGLFLVALITAFVFSAAMVSAGGAQEGKGEAEISYVEWARAAAITHVAGEILDRMGYTVQLNNVANAAMWESVATGDSDALLCAWLPITHSMFYGENGEYTDEVVDLGPNYQGAKLGLVVPAYVEEDSIPELVENAEKYDNEIVGIDPGAGMMQATEDAINNDTSGLGVFTLLEGSGPTMAAALSDAIENEEPIVVTGWKPHWKFGRWDLKILKDPAGIYGESETINTIVREGLEEDKPELYRFLDEFDWMSVDLGPVLVWNQEGMDPAESAEKFVNENTELIESALPDGMSLGE